MSSVEATSSLTSVVVMKCVILECLAAKQNQEASDELPICSHQQHTILTYSMSDPVRLSDLEYSIYFFTDNADS